MILKPGVDSAEGFMNFGATS